MASLCTSIQEAAVARLATLGLSGIPVHGMRRGDLYSSVIAALNQVGICVHVLPALPRKINGNIDGPWVESAEFAVRVVEDPLLNQTSYTRWEVMELICVTLEGWQPAITECGRCSLDPAVQESINGNLLELEIGASIPGPMLAASLPADLPPIVQAPQDTPLLKRGTTAIPAIDTIGSDGVQIAFETAFVQVPSLVLFSLLVPTWGLQMIVTERAGSRTANGFTVDLSGNGEFPEVTTGYQLSWLALL